jgi:long-chain acyl-CoA synthetase
MTNPTFESKANIEILLNRLEARGDETFLWTALGEVSTSEILNLVVKQIRTMRKSGVGPGSICAFNGDFSVTTIVIFFALASLRAVAVPFTAGTKTELDFLAFDAGVEFWIDTTTGVVSKPTVVKSGRNPLILALIESGHPGLIVFTSGSTGKPKAILHDVDRVASKFLMPRTSWRTIMFLLMDHFGGFNTLMSVLAYDGVGICVNGRTPHFVCKAVQEGRATLLPTTPTFLGILLASGIWKEYDLSTIQLVTYGAEPMPQTTLNRMREILPDVKFKQTYGLSEMGVLRSASPDQGSNWLKLGGEGFEVKIIQGLLHIRSDSSMLGYLNAPSPIDKDGWMNTGDRVEEKEGLIRFLGRSSDIINVGGQKVLPIEIEEVLMEADGIVEAIVRGVAHPLLGQVVVAQVVLRHAEELKVLSNRLRDYCFTRLQKYKVPMRFEIVDLNSITTARAKKNRI